MTLVWLVLIKQQKTPLDTYPMGLSLIGARGIAPIPQTQSEDGGGVHPLQCLSG